jgi:hypothetical protein
MSNPEGDVEDTHSRVKHALNSVRNLELGALNDGELEKASEALCALDRLDEMLAVRSEQAAATLPKDVLGDEGGDGQ